jgi:rhamnulose-1-phosphate aldolase
MTVYEEIAEIAHILWQKGWAERNAGNICVDVTDDITAVPTKTPKIRLGTSYPELSNRFFLAKATGSRFREIARNVKENLVLVQIANAADGYHILEADKSRKPTSEFPSHLAIQAYLRKNQMDQKAVLHTHPNYLIALTHITEYLTDDKLSKLLWSMHPEMKVVMPEGVGLAPYRTPGSNALADVTIEALRKHRLVVWEKHGVVAIGKDLFEAFDLIDTANKSAEIFFIAHKAGFQPQGLSHKQIAELGLLSEKMGKKT